MVWYFFPVFYSSQPNRAKGLPVITQTDLSPSPVSAGSSFNFFVTGFNRGQTTDIQIVSVSFPNLTGDISRGNSNPNGGYVKVKEYNFTQSPLFVIPGDTVGSGYSGGAETVTAKYPSIELFSRPWRAQTGYSATLEITASCAGKFVVFVKAISLPHFDKSSHYPQKGLKDYQQEFVEVYPINIK
jgi:hypothetical protein